MGSRNSKINNEPLLKDETPEKEAVKKVQKVKSPNYKIQKIVPRKNNNIFEFDIKNNSLYAYEFIIEIELPILPENLCYKNNLGFEIIDYFILKIICPIVDQQIFYKNFGTLLNYNNQLLYGKSQESKSLFFSSDKSTLQNWSNFGTSFNEKNQPCIRIFIPISIFPIPLSKLYKCDTISILLRCNSQLIENSGMDTEIIPLLHVSYSEGCTEKIRKYNKSHVEGSYGSFGNFTINYRIRYNYQINGTDFNTIVKFKGLNSHVLKSIIIHCPNIKKISYQNKDTNYEYQYFESDSKYFNEITSKNFSSHGYLPKDTYLIPSLNSSKYLISIEFTEHTYGYLELYTIDIIEFRYMDGLCFTKD